MAVGPRIQRRIKLFNKSSVRDSVQGVAEFVQRRKVQISRGTISALQTAGRWPVEYYAYVDKETRNNRYKEPERFYRVMGSPKVALSYYNKRFIFRPIIDVSGQLREAALYALKITLRQASMFYPGISPKPNTGLYLSSFKMTVDGVLATEASLNNLNEDSVIQIYNTAPYASWLEAYSLYYRASIGGVLYFAGEKVRAAYRELGVSFSYKQPDTLYGGYGSVRGGNIVAYALPVLTLGSRGMVIDTDRTPGNRIRRRVRAKRKTERLKGLR